MADRIRTPRRKRQKSAPDFSRNLVRPSVSRHDLDNDMTWITNNMAKLTLTTSESLSSNAVDVAKEKEAHGATSFYSTPSPIDKSIVKPAIGWNSLPVELKQGIYKHLLVSSQPIDLFRGIDIGRSENHPGMSATYNSFFVRGWHRMWFESNDTDLQLKERVSRNYFALRQERNSQRCDRFQCHYTTSHVPGESFITQGSHIKFPVELFRISREEHRVARDVFYRENKFKFSGPHSFIALECFLRTIGAESCGLIRHLSIHIPLWQSQKEMDNLLASFIEASCLHTRFEIIREPEGDRLEAAFLNCMDTISNCCRLAELNLLVKGHLETWMGRQLFPQVTRPALKLAICHRMRYIKGTALEKDVLLEFRSKSPKTRVSLHVQGIVLSKDGTRRLLNPNEEKDVLTKAASMGIQCMIRPTV
ncbi:hypothetical protein M501DRAFT_987380 [Patellaria atrata CBS 101060]|uniref:Uncharacterized protein n=1 Tax=Patellaria atrata CBS 101060 TaxID=1346257 RepID=A0A9P4VQ59_9PEZI|nr:hypothetical protein M501DRAFT_987380 [Patellaria atrata CBS 101060]